MKKIISVYKSTLVSISKLPMLVLVVLLFAALGTFVHMAGKPNTLWILIPGFMMIVFIFAIIIKETATETPFVNQKPDKQA